VTAFDAHKELDFLLNRVPRFGEISLKCTVHEGNIVRFERTISEKVALQKDIGDTVLTASGGGDAKR